jgi:hypothetical protein
MYDFFFASIRGDMLKLACNEGSGIKKAGSER